MNNEIEEKRIKVKDLSVFYRVFGQGDPVLLLHGWGGSSFSWREVIKFLASNGYEVYAPDLPGFGQTEEPKQEWKIEDYADFAMQFLKEVNKEKAHLIGHSFGGGTAIKLAVKKQEIINKLVLIDAAAIRRQRLTLRQKVSKFLANHFAKLIAKTPFHHFFEKLAYALAGTNDYYKASPLMRKVFLNIINEDLTYFFPQVKNQCLIVWGANDKATPLEDAFTINELIEGSELKIIKGAGHNPHFKQLDKLNKIIINFLKK